MHLNKYELTEPVVKAWKLNNCYRKFVRNTFVKYGRKVESPSEIHRIIFNEQRGMWIKKIFSRPKSSDRVFSLIRDFHGTAMINI